LVKKREREDMERQGGDLGRVDQEPVIARVQGGKY